MGGTLGPHRYRGIGLTRACASPPCDSGFSMVRPQLRSLGDASVGTALLGIRSPGKAEQKIRRRRPDGEERKVLAAPHEASKADLFPKCCWAGVCRDGPCPAVHPSAREAIPCARRRLGRPPSCLYVTGEGSCTLLSCQPSSSKDLPSPSCFLEPAAGLPCVSDCVGHPQLHTSPARAAPGLANGSLGLPAAGLRSGPRQGRGTTLQLAGGRGG